MVCIGGICFGNVWQILCVAFLLFRLWSTYREGQLMAGSKVDNWKGPQNAANRQRAEQLGYIAPSEHVSSMASFKSVIEKLGTSGPSFMKRDKTRYVLIKFSATWCGPCRKVAPFVDLLRYCYKFALINVDIDHADGDLKKHANAVPTFILLRIQENTGPVTGLDWFGFSVVSKIQGANAAAIEGLLARNCAPQEKLPQF